MLIKVIFISVNLYLIYGGDRIKQFIRLLGVDLRRAILSKGFLIGIIATFLSIYVSSGMKFHHTQNIVETFNISYSQGTNYLIIILVCTFAYSSSLCSDLNSNITNFIVVRTSPKKYCISKCISCSIASGMAISIGCFLFLIVLINNLSSFMPNINIPEIRNEMEVIAFGRLLIANKPILYFLCVFLVIFIQSSFWACLGLCISSYLPNKYIAYTSPFISYFIFNEIANILGLPIWLRPVTLGLIMYDLGGTIKTMFITLGVFITLIVICSTIFTINVKRRIAND